MLHRIALALGLALSLLAGIGSVAIAGQPSVECDDFSSTPGQSASAPGSAFAEDGKAGTVYAGEQPQNSTNEHSVSQYDVACRNVSRYRRGAPAGPRRSGASAVAVARPAVARPKDQD